MIEKNKLLKAILKGNYTQVRDCIVDGEDVFYRDEHGRNYLHLSVFLRNHALLFLFIDEGIDINQGDHDNLTPIHWACRNGFDTVMHAMFMHGANPNAEAKDSIRPLHIAAAFGHEDSIHELYSWQSSDSRPGDWRYVDLNCRDINDHTPLHYAAAEGHIRAASKLIEFNCDVNAENRAGNRPLHFASVVGSPELCQVLLSANADINAQNHNGQTALHFATRQACVNTVMFLLSRKADPNIRDANGSTCSHLAIKNGHIALLKILMMDPRTDSSISDNDENTVLHVALKLGHFNLIPAMLPRARDLTRQNASGCSVIIEAIKNQLEDLALEMLKTCPSLVHTATHDLVTPLHLAAERGMTNLTKQLLISGAQVDAADAGGLTPSLYCAKNDSVLECLAMIEDIMVMPLPENNTDNDNEQQQQQHVKGNGSKVSSRISS